ncbi:transmembrane protein, putative [Medicago truncatula]|uniref:Transmembrane protein, putative n=1 Tax=Medicago truncatula TaxID=3880 RepID=A0A072UD51_MEDTR|nr:transmembrane protein, putative [Medicago truncatula]
MKKSESGGYVRADQIDLKSLDEQLQRHLTVEHGLWRRRIRRKKMKMVKLNDLAEISSASPLLVMFVLIELLIFLRFRFTEAYLSNVIHHCVAFSQYGSKLKPYNTIKMLDKLK